MLHILCVSSYLYQILPPLCLCVDVECIITSLDSSYVTLRKAFQRTRIQNYVYFNTSDGQGVIGGYTTQFWLLNSIRFKKLRNTDTE